MLKLPEDYLTDPYVSSHFGDTPNILAHIRVQDFKSPEGKKVLLVDEVQSDWHQTGRKQGYKTGYEEGKISTLSKEYDALSQRRKDLLKAAEEMPNGGEAFAKLIDEANDITPKLMGLQSQMDDLRTVKSRGVPDAPFKKNWHELAMKRVLDYAAENGYDTVAITPGAEQAKRYDLSKHIDELHYNPELQTLVGNKDREGKLYERGVTPEKLQDYVGKEMAAKLIAQEPTEQGLKSLSGVDLQVGGEGMKGFYDKILPDYLNTYGKQYGAKVGELQLPAGQEMSRGPSGTDMVPTYTPIMQNFHSFDITPQMREAIKTKGQPLYSAMGAEGLAAGTGAATIGADALTGNTEQPVQKPVHFTENPDAMLLEMMQRN